MNNEIKITVTGRSGSGKSTVADLITRLLLDEGFTVEQEQFEELSASFYMPGACQRRKEAVRDHSKISINEVQAPRDPRTVLK